MRALTNQIADIFSPNDKDINRIVDEFLKNRNKSLDIDTVCCQYTPEAARNRNLTAVR